MPPAGIGHRRAPGCAGRTPLAPGLQEDQQGVTQSSVVLVVGGQAPQRAQHPGQVRGERVLHLVLGTDPLQASARTVNEANRQHPAMTSHLPGRKPGYVVKARMAARGTCLRFKGETVTSVSGACSAPALRALYSGRYARAMSTAEKSRTRARSTSSAEITSRKVEQRDYLGSHG